MGKALDPPVANVFHLQGLFITWLHLDLSNGILESSHPLIYPTTHLHIFITNIKILNIMFKHCRNKRHEK
jgi:hypothetical protein